MHLEVALETSQIIAGYGYKRGGFSPPLHRRARYDDPATPAQKKSSKLKFNTVTDTMQYLALESRDPAAALVPVAIEFMLFGRNRSGCEKAPLPPLYLLVLLSLPPPMISCRLTAGAGASARPNKVLPPVKPVAEARSSGTSVGVLPGAWAGPEE